MIVEFPFPPATLSGHANGNKRWEKIALTAKWRAMAKRLTEQAGSIALPEEGDILVHYHFEMPDRRSDRGNAYRRTKAIEDGIADALGVNDRRFLPSISFSGPLKPGKVVVTIGGVR
jgi:crossover junction endodeoxyribonuclease RusA